MALSNTAIPKEYGAFRRAVFQHRLAKTALEEDDHLARRASVIDGAYSASSRTSRALAIPAENLSDSGVPSI